MTTTNSQEIAGVDFLSEMKGKKAKGRNDLVVYRRNILIHRPDSPKQATNYQKLGC